MNKIAHFLFALTLVGSGAQGAEMNLETFLPSWALLGPEQQEKIAAQYEEIDLNELERQRAVIQGDEDSLGSLSPFIDYELSGSLPDFEKGKKLLEEGKVGCLIVAGGQGSRLKFDHPKGLYPVTLIKKKPLFQLFAERILAAGERAGRSLPVAVMTSTENHQETLQSFEQHNYFGLSKDQLFFFSQKSLPFLDTQGNLFLETKNTLAMGPNGNASSLKEFVDSGIWSQWHAKGVEYLNYMHIDNALADPFDAELTGFHSRNKSSDIIVKCIQRENPEEKIGVLFEMSGKVGVVEYSELSQDEKTAKNKDGSLKNKCANIGLYSFSMGFVQNVATSYYAKLPFHKAWKAATYLTADGISKKSDKPIAWKFEKFIFDVMPFAQDVKALLYSRFDCFAPLKNATGEDSIVSVQEALQRKDRNVFESVTGTSTDSLIFELDPVFYYPSKELVQKWKGKDLSGDYISP